MSSDPRDVIIITRPRAMLRRVRDWFASMVDRALKAVGK
jgi:hypothetical protein